MWFYPGAPRFQRGVMLLTVTACTFVGAHVIMGDFGTQKHVFTSVQAWIVPRVDEYYNVTEKEISTAMTQRSAKRQAEMVAKQAGKDLALAAASASATGSSNNPFRNQANAANAVAQTTNARK
jgi:hypothetical protein